MMRKLYLHIGAHRTATSSIQELLFLQPDRLAAQGFHYPLGVKRHFDLANRLLAGTLSPARAARQISDSADRARGRIHSIILSDEDICTRKTLAPLAALANHFTVIPVMFLRRQDLWLESWYQQNVKWQWNSDLAHLPFPEFLARRHLFHWIDYDTYIRRIEGLFGTKAILCRAFEKTGMPHGPVAAFCEAVGIDFSQFPKLPRTNSSLSPLMTEFIRQLPLDEISPPRRRLFENACARADWHLRRAFPDQSPLLMDFSTRCEILAEHASHNAALARRHFDRDILFQDPLPSDDAALAPRSLADTPEDLMRLYVAPLIRAVAQLQDEAGAKK